MQGFIVKQPFQAKSLMESKKETSQYQLSSDLNLINTD